MRAHVHPSFRPARKRRRGVARLFVLGAAVAASASLGADAVHAATRTSPAPWTAGPLAQAPASATAPVLAFDIPAGLLEQVLAAFRAVTGMEVTTTTQGLLTLTSPGVSGTFTPVEALTRLLTGTGVAFTLTGPNSATLDIEALRESVSVTADAPAVSLPQFTQPLRDIPQSVQVIPAEVLREQHVTSLRDVLRNVPGITFQAGEGGGGLPGDTFTMRGFSATNNTFVDGVRDLGAYSRDAFNLEQVEIAKGPSSSIAGRGSTGGAINQVTKSPNLAVATAATLSVGNADAQRVTVDVNRPLPGLGESTAFRVNAMWSDAGVPGRSVVENQSWAVAPSLAFGLGQPTQVTLKYQHLAQDNVPDYGLPWGTNYPGYTTGAFQADPPISQDNFYGLRDYDFERIDNDLATAEIRHDFGTGLVLRNTTRFGRTERDSAITAPRPPNRQLQRRTMGSQIVTNQTTATLAAGGDSRVRHALVAGLDLTRESTDNRNSAQNTNQPQTTIENPDPNDRPFGPMPANGGNPSETTLNQVGLYLFDTVTFGSRWEVTGGLRWDAVETDYALTTLSTGVVTELEASDRMVSWRGGVVYKPRDNGSVYVGYGTSFNPSVDAGNTGPALSTNTNAANSPTLDPEETRNYEVGTKWDLADERLAVTGAIFRTEKVNARTRNANNEPFILDGRQRVTGVELSVSGQITDRWDALMAYTFMDSAIAASANANEEGNNLTLLPESTFSLWTTFDVLPAVTVGGGLQYMDAVFRNTTNTQSVPSYWLVNAVAAYRLNENLTLRLNGQNLGDEQYVDRVGGGHYIPGPRRAVTLTADLGF